MEEEEEEKDKEITEIIEINYDNPLLNEIKYE